MILIEVNGPYSLLVHASYFIFCSTHTQFTSVSLSFENGTGGIGTGGIGIL